MEQAQRNGVFAVVVGTLLAIGIPLGAQETASAEVVRVGGLVQVRDTITGAWTTVRDDDVIAVGATVISGIDGYATFEIGSAVVELAPLSRVVIGERTNEGDRERTRLNLSFGTLSSRVRRSSNRGVDFRVATPLSTAAVRGTEFTFDGYELAVHEGDVAFTNRIGQHHSVREGQLSRAWGFAPIESVETTRIEELSLR